MKIFNQFMVKNKRVVISTLTTSLIPFSFIFNSVAIDELPPRVEKESKVQIPEVFITEVDAKKQLLKIKGYAQTQPRYSIDIVAQVNGKILSLTEQFVVGNQLDKGTAIAKVDATDYEQQLAEAEFLVAQSKVKVLEEERKIKITKKDRKDINSDYLIDSPLVFGQPQLISAKSGLKSANTQLKTAQKNILNTLVTVPFNSIITKRHVAPGQYIREGDKLATINGAKELQFHVNLPANQWQILLNHKNSSIKATISDANGNQWKGKFSHAEQHVNAENRQRTIIFKVENPLSQSPQLLAGSFVEVDIEFTMDMKLLAIPVKSLAPDGKVWYVDNQGLLAYFYAELVFQNEGMLYLYPPKNTEGITANKTALSAVGKLKIINSPSMNYAPGQHVSPI